MGRLIRLIRGIGWGVGDQALSSLTNFALSVLIAREVSPDGFGAFTLGFATYIIVLSVGRAVATEPLMVRYSGERAGLIRRGMGDAAGTALVLGLIAGIGAAAFAIVAGGDVRGAFLALAITFPGLMLQDAWRLGFFASKRGGHAFASDAVWALVLFPGAAIFEVRDIDSVFAFTLLWGGAATVAGLVGIAQARAWPQPQRALSWLREHRDLTPNFMGELLALSGARQLVLYGVGAIVGLAATGAFRAAQLLLNPLHILTQGIRLMVIPDAVRMLKNSSPSEGVRLLRRQGVRLSFWISTVALVIGGIAIALPDTIGRELLGETWPSASRLLLPVTLSTAFGGVVSGASVGLRALAAARHSRHARFVMSSAQLSGGLVGAAVGGAHGAAWGLAVANMIGAATWWWHLTRAMGEHREIPTAYRLEDDLPVVAD